MHRQTTNTGGVTTTSHRIVLPFYLYAALAFLVSTVLLLLSATEIANHYFQPHTLAIIHIMALGWGTMIILGSGHQLAPVLIEGKLFSDKLAYTSFVLSAVGIPLLAYGFYVFDMGWPAKWGGRLVILSILAYVVNLTISMVKCKRKNIHAIYLLTAVIWLLATALVGLMLVYNFKISILPANSVDYLPLHAHIGIIGWFLLLIVGVASRLIPMFLISKYHNVKTLWWIYGLINSGLLTFIYIFINTSIRSLLFLPLILVSVAIILFINYCYRSYIQRIRTKVDEQMKLTLFSVAILLSPVAFATVIILLSAISSEVNLRLVITYGFVIFFGWLTAIIMGITFKTLPFIIWNKVYHDLAGKTTTPNPKDLFSSRVFRYMVLSYLPGFLIFFAGILLQYIVLLQTGAVLLICTAAFYNFNVMKLLIHKSDHL
jgi:hypothetical protein